MSEVGFFAVRRRHISDPVLGTIPIFEDCDNRLIDDLPLLQRLRRVKQLPVVSYVFPTADHSRFAHSLGAYYWAQHYAEALQLEEVQARLVRWAALLHDVGHYPCSHTLEKVYQRIPWNPLTKDEPAPAVEHWENAAADPLGFVCWAPSGPRDWGHHEALTEYVLSKDNDLRGVIRNEAPGFSVEDLLGVIKRNPPPETAHLRQIFHSQVDVDRMDYLVRDSQVAGARYGLVEPSHIIRRARIVESAVRAADDVTTDEQSKCKFIAYDRSAVSRLDHFVLARYFYYSNVVYHRAVLGFDLLLRAVCASLVASNVPELPADFEGVKKLCDKGLFYHFTDDLVYRRAAEQAREKTLAGEFCRMLLNRTHPIAAIELRATRQNGRLIPQMSALLNEFRDRNNVRTLAQEAGVEAERVGWTSWELSFENLYPFRSPIELVGAQPESEDVLDQIYVVRQAEQEPELLSKHDGSLLSALRDRSMVGACVYYFSETEASSEVEKLKQALSKRIHLS